MAVRVDEGGGVVGPEGRGWDHPQAIVHVAITAGDVTYEMDLAEWGVDFSSRDTRFVSGWDLTGSAAVPPVQLNDLKLHGRIVHGVTATVAPQPAEEETDD